MPGYEASVWTGVGVPRGTPPEIIERLNREINAGLVNPTIKARLAALRCNPVTLADNPPQSLDSMSSLSLDVRGHVWGAVMKCLACGADNKMLLTDVVRDNTVKPVIERQIYMCSVCKHFARRLVFRRAVASDTQHASSVLETPCSDLSRINRATDFCVVRQDA